MTVRPSGDMFTNVSTNFADNSSGSITPAITRTQLNDMIESAPTLSLSSGTTGGAVVLDLRQPSHTLTLNAHVTLFTTSNRDSLIGRAARIRINAGAADRNLNFSNWGWVGTKPTGIPANRSGFLGLFSFGNAETDIVASYEILSTGNGI